MSMNQSNNQIIKKNLLIICRGAGDLATGIIHRRHRAGHRVIALETDYPAAIRLSLIHISRQTALVSLVRSILMRTGHVRQDVITSISLESMVDVYKRQTLTSGFFIKTPAWKGLGTVNIKSYILCS